MKFLKRSSDPFTCWIFENSKPLKAEVRGTAVLRLLHEKGNTNNASNCLLSNHFFSRPNSLSFLALLVACDNVILSLKGTEA